MKEYKTVEKKNYHQNEGKTLENHPVPTAFSLSFISDMTVKKIRKVEVLTVVSCYDLGRADL